MVEEKQEGGCILPPPPGKIGLKKIRRDPHQFVKKGREAGASVREWEADDLASIFDDKRRLYRSKKKYSRLYGLFQEVKEERTFRWTKSVASSNAVSTDGSSKFAVQTDEYQKVWTMF